MDSPSYLDEALKSKTAASLFAPPPPKAAASPGGAPPSGAEAMSQLRDLLESRFMEALNIFGEWDVNGDGKISPKEWHGAMEKLGFDVPKAAIDALFKYIDKDGNKKTAPKDQETYAGAPGINVRCYCAPSGTSPPDPTSQ